MLRHSVFLFLLCFTFFACKQNTREEINLVAQGKKEPIQSGKEVQILYSDSAEVMVKITAPELEQYADSGNYYEIFPKGLTLLTFDGGDTSRVESSIRCKYATRKNNGNYMEAQKDVVVVNENGEQLNTEKLIWDKIKAQIYTDAFVKITTADEVIFGDGLESNEEFTKYKIKKIKGTINLKEEANE